MSSATLLSAADGGGASTRGSPLPPPERSCDIGGSIYSAGDVLLDRYRLVSPLAEGGSGVVWVALNTVLGNEVAVKIITSSRHEPAAVSNRRAASEARVCAQLAHPAICRVVDFGFTDHRDPFVVSELLHGETLDDLIARETRLAPVRAVQLLLPILDALEAAHHHGVVHRDVKPANIFLAHEGEGIQPKLLDFGIARCSNPADGRVTKTGVVCGTPFYMSPEQARGSNDIDLRSDLWSFCITLYEALAGVPAFSGENYNEILWSILHSEATPLETFEVDLLLARIVLRGLNKVREQRWCSAAALSQELASWLLRQGVDSDIRGFSLRQRVPSSVAPDSAKPSSGPHGTVSDPSSTSSRSGPATAAVRRRSRALWASTAAGLVAVLATTASLALSGSKTDTSARADVSTTQPAEPPRHHASIESSLPAVETSSPEDELKALTPSPVAQVELAAPAPAPAPARRIASLGPLPRSQAAPVHALAARAASNAVAQPRSTTTHVVSSPTQPASKSAPSPSNRKSNALAFDFGL
jgi:serine/threonine-protein kinase